MDSDEDLSCTVYTDQQIASLSAVSRGVTSEKPHFDTV